MATAATTIDSNTPALARPFGQTLTIYAKEIKFEFLTRLRLRAFSLSTIGFPVMFYILFGLVLNGKEASVNGTHFATYLIATFGTFGVMGASLFGTAAGLATERGLGWLQVKRASPMPPFAYFAAKVVMSMIFSAAVVLSLFALGVTLGEVHLTAMQAMKQLDDRRRRGGTGEVSYGQSHSAEGKRAQDQNAQQFHGLHCGEMNFAESNSQCK